MRGVAVCVCPVCVVIAGFEMGSKGMVDGSECNYMRFFVF